MGVRIDSALFLLLAGIGAVVVKGTCPPTLTRCPTPRHLFDSARCKCVCPPHLQLDECPGSQTFDPNLCACRCSHYHPPCASNQVFNESSCQCVCKNPPQCPPGKELSRDQSQCLCQNARTPCPSANHIFDTSTCSCLCPLHRLICRSPRTFDEKSCECVCPGNIACPVGQRLDVWCVCTSKPLTCSTALSRTECLTAQCDRVPSKTCIMDHANRCVCPCCKTKSSPQFSFWCIARSSLPRDACIPAFCKYVC